jgi:hypothetical protein
MTCPACFGAHTDVEAAIACVRQSVTQNPHPATTLAGTPKSGVTAPEKSGTSNTVKRYRSVGGRPRKTAEEKRRTTRERVRRWRAA